MKNKSCSSRRDFIKATACASLSTLAVGGFPSIVPASVLSDKSPSNRINVGAIGTGRISRDHDMPGVWKNDRARIIAVCDVDSKRAQDAKALVNKHYAKRRQSHRAHMCPEIQVKSRSLL